MRRHNMLLLNQKVLSVHRIKSTKTAYRGGHLVPDRSRARATKRRKFPFMDTGWSNTSQYDAAKSAYKRVLDRDPKHAKVLQQLGWLHHQQSGEYENQERAIEYLEKSVASGTAVPSLQSPSDMK
jgi:tetratricopeptide (TPR) repeat protein